MIDLPDDILRQVVDIQQVQIQIDRLDTGIEDLEDIFYSKIDERCIQIENIEDEDIEKH